MRILILDDQKLRHEFFAKQFDGHEVVSVFKFSEFCELLNQRWDLMHLDHDLGDDVDNPDTFVDGWGSTQLFNGGHAVLKVCELPNELKPAQVIIHSINPDGAKVMLSMLERVGIPVVWVPFNDPTLHTCSWCEKQFRSDNLDDCCSAKCNFDMKNAIEWARNQ